MNAETGHSDESAGHVTGTSSRSRAPLRGDVPNVPGTYGAQQTGTLRGWDGTSRSASLTRDIPSHGTGKRARAKPGGQNWMHLAAMNLIADADAGIEVDALRLQAARAIVARELDPKPAPARAIEP